MNRSSFPWPGPARITLVALALVPALLAYPWPTGRDRTVLAVGVLVALVLLGGWQGLHFTTIVRRRLSMLRSRHGAHIDRGTGPDVATTTLLRIVAPAEGAAVLPLPLLAGYLDRYGLRADAVRITSRDVPARAGEPAQRTTWIGLTYCAAANLAALQARSARIPLAETAQVAARRLADHLRELGWETAPATVEDVPPLFGAGSHETWRAVADGSGDYVAAYRIGVDGALSDTLANIRAVGAAETWTALEFAGDGEQRTVAAACAARTREVPGVAPVPGVRSQQGNQYAALRTLQPFSGQRLDGHTAVGADQIAALRWPTGAAPRRAGVS